MRLARLWTRVGVKMNMQSDAWWAEDLICRRRNVRRKWHIAVFTLLAVFRPNGNSSKLVVHL